MIQRINLIEKEPFKLNYQKLVNIVVSIIFLCVLFYGSQVLRVVLAKKEVNKLKGDITRLKEEQERIVKRVEPKWKGNSAAGQLKGIFSANPVWTDVLNDVSLRLPSSVWLTGFKTTGDETEKGTKKEGKKEAKKGEVKKGGISISGLARSATDLSLFVSQLEESPYIAKAALRESKVDNGNFAFEIDCDMVKAQQ